MKQSSTELHKATQLLRKTGGMATLKKYGLHKLRRWGKLRAEFGKPGGRPPKVRKEINE
jgi:hypothetical protein